MRYQLTVAAVVVMAGAFAFTNNNGILSRKGTNITIGPSIFNAADSLDIPGCPVKIGIDRTVCLADAFKKQLSADQVAAVELPYSVISAKRWSNLPQGMVRGNNNRIGLSLAAMNPEQLRYAKALVKSVAGQTADEGWDELQQLVNADDYLGANGGGKMYGAANYYITILGTAAKTGTFEIQFGGHHLAFGNTYKDGVLVGATPSFRGVEPFNTFSWNGKNNQPIQQEQAALSAMLSGLTDEQLAKAKLDKVYSDIVTGPQNDNSFPATQSGIACSELSAKQKALVLKAIATYVGDVANADAITKKYTKELDKTYLSYSGTTGMTTRNDYVRLDGPSLWLEYVCQNGVIMRATHPHSVWRDKMTDYGGNK